MAEEKPPSFRESLDNSLVEVAESPTLQVLLYPVVPAPLREWVVGRGEAIARKRLKEFLALLSEQIEALQNQGVNKEHFERFFDSEKWFDLFRQTLEEALKTRGRDRKEYYARILGGAIADFEQGRYAPEDYLNLIASLSDLELKVAGVLYVLQKNLKPKTLDVREMHELWREHKERICAEQGVDRDDLDLICERLSSMGLLERIYANVPGSPIPTYWVSNAFGRVMEFLGLNE